MEDYSEFVDDFDELIQIYAERNNIKITNRKDYVIVQTDSKKLIWLFDQLEKPTKEQLIDCRKDLIQFKQKKQKRQFQEIIRNNELFPLLREIMQRLRINVEEINI